MNNRRKSEMPRLNVRDYSCKKSKGNETQRLRIGEDRWKNSRDLKMKRLNAS